MSDATSMTDSTTVVACTLSEQEQAERSEELARDLFAFAEQADELPDGYCWRFPGDGDWHARLLDIIAAERRCCPFFRMELAFEPGLGPVWLTLGGPAGTKAFIDKHMVA